MGDERYEVVSNGDKTNPVYGVKDNPTGYISWVEDKETAEGAVERLKKWWENK